jgi:YD repeat-containing protein
MAVAIQFSSSPYPGLRPFRYDESDIFFGRERQTDQLLARLAHNRFLAVIGPSGCGKSSLVKAGMLPALTAGFMAEVGSRWRICELRPGDRPLGRLARALASPDVLGADRDSEESAAFLEATLRRGPLGLIEVVKGAEALQGATLLVLVDQFEELFRFREQITADEADAFVALLLASVGQHEVPIYVVITMRSDYLGECAVFQGLPEAVSDSQYLTPRLTREELELAIAGPARVFGGQVDLQLQNRLINDFGTDSDQLPLLQHAMARLWSRCSVLVEAPLLTVEDYEAIGGIATALSKHGDEVLAELTPEQQRIAEIMFRRLSGSENGRRDIRAPARVEEVAKIAAVEVDEVIAVAEAFRRSDCRFLAAPEGPLRADTLLDVSHESLIRQWQRLAGWVAAEADSTEMYERLCDWALHWERGNAQLWGGPDLANALAWRQREQPSPEWGERYGGRDRFQRTMRFLDASEAAQHAAAAAEETWRQAQLRLRRIRRLAWGFGAATVSLVAAILIFFVGYRSGFNAYYKDYVRVWGVPQGIGPLSAAEVGRRVASYKITRQGRLGPVVSMQLVNAAGQPRNLQGTLEALSADEMANKVSRREYVYDAQGQIAYEVLLDRHGQRLQSIIYSPSEPGPVRSRNVYTISQDGSLAPQKGSCAAFLSHDYTPEGYIWRVHYLDQAGHPTPGKDNAYIKQSQYDRQGRVIESTSLWKDGRPMNDQDGNAATRSSYDDSGNLVAREWLDAAGNPIDVKKSGNQRYTCRYDDRGNCVEPAHWRADGSRVYSAGQIFCHSRRLFHDDRGNTIGGDCLMANGQPVISMRVKYDADDRPIEDTYFDRTGHPAVGPLGGFRTTLTHDAEGNGTDLAFFDESGKATSSNEGYHRKISKFERGREVRTEYQDGDGKLVAIKGGYAAIDRTFDAQGNEVRTAYFGLDNRPVANRNEGFAIVLTTFDACGRATEKRFLDEDERPVRSKKGYAHLRQAYDESNNVNEETYLDESGQPIRSVDGYARVTRKFDRHRNVIDERYFDEQGKALLLKGAYAEHKSRYDDHNALVEEAFLGAGGEPVLNDKGWARHTRRYDDNNALVEEAYFGASGEPVLNNEGWARMTSINDAYGRAIERTYFGADGKPVNGKQGYAKRAWRYDNHGVVLESAFFGTSGEPVLNDEGLARFTNVNDEFGRTIEQAFFGMQGEPVVGTKNYRYHRSKRVRDERDNEPEFATFGTDGKPLSGKEGYAKVIRRFDARNALVEAAYFGTDGEPVLHEDGYARVTYVRDNHGQVIERAFFGTDGQPIKQKQGYARLIARYDHYGAFVEEVYFGVNEEPVLRDGRFARISVIPDKLGRLIEWAYFGVRGEPAIGPENRPFHRARRIPDERDNELELVTFGTDGKPLEVVDATSGRRCAKLVRRFDATNKEIDSACFDAAGNPTSTKSQ